MAKFITGNDLNSQLSDLLENSKEVIILISPYIKLHERYASILKTKKDNPNIHLVIVFGKNEDDLSKSMKEIDFNFFKEFPSVEIKYEKNLHAKYYANEKEAIITSMNLYNYSQDNNIEAGVMTKTTLLGNIIGDDGVDGEAWNYFSRVIEQAELLFDRVPTYSTGILNTGINSQYIESTNEVDKLSDFFTNRKEYLLKKKEDKKVTKMVSPSENFKKTSNGYCIRTSKEIPFNPKRPFSDESFKSWNKYKDVDYKEKYCHYSGENTGGETCFSKPILKKNWKKAKEMHRF